MPQIFWLRTDLVSLSTFLGLCVCLPVGLCVCVCADPAETDEPIEITFGADSSPRIHVLY